MRTSQTVQNYMYVHMTETHTTECRTRDKRFLQLILQREICEIMNPSSVTQFFNNQECDGARAYFKFND